MHAGQLKQGNTSATVHYYMYNYEHMDFTEDAMTSSVFCANYEVLLTYEEEDTVFAHFHRLKQSLVLTRDEKNDLKVHDA